MPKGSPRPNAGRKPASPTGEKGFLLRIYVYPGDPEAIVELLAHRREEEREAIEREKEE